MMLSLDTAYRSFGGEVEALSTPTICRPPDSAVTMIFSKRSLTSRAVLPLPIERAASLSDFNTPSLSGSVRLGAQAG